jgi:hypothetical protein
VSGSGAALYVTTLSGKTLTLEVGNDNLASIKAKISDKEGIPSSKIIIVNNGRQLDAFDTLLMSEANILPDSSISYVLRPRGEAVSQVKFIVTRDQNSTIVAFDVSDRVVEIKRQIAQTEKIALDQIAIEFWGQELSDSLEVAQAGIYDGAEVIWRLRQGRSFVDVLRLQSSTGYWEHSPNLQAAAEISSVAVPNNFKPSPDPAVASRAWATVSVLAWLETTRAEYEHEWVQAAEKASQWLSQFPIEVESAKAQAGEFFSSK